MGFRNARIKAGLSVRDVMEKLKVSDAAVYQWEKGQTKPRGGRLLDIAKLYNCTVEELLKAEV